MFFVSNCRGFDPDPEFSEIATKMWEADCNCCQPGVHYEIDIQGNGRHYAGEKSAPEFPYLCSIIWTEVYALKS